MKNNIYLKFSFYNSFDIPNRYWGEYTFLLYKLSVRVGVSFCSLNHLLFVICITKIAIYQIFWENIKTIHVRSKVVNFPKLKGKGMCVRDGIGTLLKYAKIY